MKLTKNFFTVALLVGLMLMTAILGLSISSMTANASAENEHQKYTHNIESMTKEIFGDVGIKSSEYLYNFDNSPDFIYVDFEDYGYAIYFRETLELLQYAPQGSLPYPNASDKKFYAGPANYLIKDGEALKNIITGDRTFIADAVAKEYSRGVRDAFSNSKDTENKQIEKNETADYTNLPNSSGGNSNPPNYTGLIAADPPGAVETTYIPNAQYFLNNPRHGYNSTGTCNAVAAQLLLSYNNYYNDRRIIAEQHLNGNWDRVNNIFSTTNNPNQSPNTCVDPRSMTRDTLGSNGYNETDANSYFALVVNAISANTSTSQLKTGLNNILNARNNQIAGTINYNTNTSTNIFGSISTTNIKNEINAGRPLMVALRGSLGGTSDKKGGHAVVAYGYQDYTYPVGHVNEGETYFGYITHFGWSDNFAYGLNMWVNSAWCDGYVTLQINHTHTYTSTGIVHDGQNMELQCSVCNHRTVDTLFDSSGGTITGLKYALMSETNVVIPATIGGTTITEIGPSAFAGCTQLSQIEICGSVRNIGEGTFSECSSLTKISLPFVGNQLGGTTNTNFGYIFQSESDLRENICPESLKTVIIKGGGDIGANAFDSCYYIKHIEIQPPEYYYDDIRKVKKIGNSAFFDCVSLETAVLPDSVTEIGGYAFSNCANLKNINMPANLEIIANEAFDGCGKIEKIILPETVESIRRGAFQCCYKLEYIKLPSGLKVIEESVFPAAAYWRV